MGNKASSPPPAAAPLLQPAMEGDLDRVKQDVEDFLAMLQGPSGAAAAVHGRLATFLNQQDGAGNAAIHGAVFCGHLSLVQYLAENGASLELANGLGCTPLWLAAGYNRLEVLQYLMDHVSKH